VIFVEKQNLEESLELKNIKLEKRGNATFCKRIPPDVKKMLVEVYEIKKADRKSIYGEVNKGDDKQN
jgi:hypothetical protein